MTILVQIKLFVVVIGIIIVLVNPFTMKLIDFVDF